jgi:hypothetical protein
MAKIENGQALQTGVVPEPKGATDMLVVSEINRSMWSTVINDALKKADGKIGKYRFMGVSLLINGKDILVAQGIWDEKEAQAVKDGIKDNKPSTDDYSEYSPKEGVKRITFYSNTEVINYLIENKTFVKGENSNDTGPYKLTYYPILGKIEELPINLDIYLLKESHKAGLTLFVMDLSDRK